MNRTACVIWVSELPRTRASHRESGRLRHSGVLTFEDPAHRIDVNIEGVDTLTLRVNDGGDGPANDHANWADAQLHLAGRPSCEA